MIASPQNVASTTAPAPKRLIPSANNRTPTVSSRTMKLPGCITISKSLLATKSMRVRHITFLRESDENTLVFRLLRRGRLF
jgi:hypothetical protein